MMRLFSAVIAAGSILLCGSAFAEAEPQDWLNRMAAVVHSISYEGTVIRIHGSNVEALKVVHTVENGVVQEKVVAQEGSSLEIIRNGNEVHRILPDRRSVLVEEWDDKPTLFSTLPSSDVRFGSEYDVSIVRKERVAGRETIMLAIRAHDGYRYGHRIWLDTETAFPLQTQLISDGEAIDQVKFAEIRLNQEIHASALEPSVSTEHFTWLRQSTGHEGSTVKTDWNSESLPSGFRAVSIHEDTMASSEEVVTHILFSDGLANVSVFIAARSGELQAGPARLGGSNAYSVEYGDFEITAIGEVPAMTVEQIATSMRRP